MRSDKKYRAYRIDGMLGDEPCMNAASDTLQICVDPDVKTGDYTVAVGIRSRRASMLAGGWSGVVLDSTDIDAWISALKKARSECRRITAFLQREKIKDHRTKVSKARSK